MGYTYAWRGAFESREVERLHAEAFSHAPVEGFDWLRQVTDHSLGWVCARDGADLVGFVNVAWDGAAHAFVLDTMVAASAGRQGVGTTLVSVAVEHARAAGCEWIHVDFDHHLQPFYVDACRFTPAPAGVIDLRRP